MALVHTGSMLVSGACGTNRNGCVLPAMAGRARAAAAPAAMKVRRCMLVVSLLSRRPFCVGVLMFRHRTDGAYSNERVISTADLPGVTGPDHRSCPSRPRPEDARITFQRAQLLAAVGPLRRLFESDVIARLPSGAGLEQSARDVYHFRRAWPLVEQGRAACRAEASGGVAGFVLEADDAVTAERDTDATFPDSNIGGIGGAMRVLGRSRVVVPGPERRVIDFQAHRATDALAGCGRR